MANVKITDLPQINFSSITNNDVIPIVDVDSNTTSKVLISDLTTFFSTPFTGGTVSGLTEFTNGLVADTISATTYQNLPIDVYVTGGTYSNGVTTFTNNIGGTFSVSGYFTGQTDVFVTGFTYSNNELVITQSNSSSLSVQINEMSGLTINGTLSATTYENIPKSVPFYANSIWTSFQQSSKVVSSVNLGSNNSYAVGINIPVPTRIKNASIEISNYVGTNSAEFAIYNVSSGIVTTQIYYQTFTISGNGIYTFSVNLDFNEGNYAYVTNHTLITGFRCISNPDNIFGVSPTMGVNTYPWAKTATIFTNLPDPYPIGQSNYNLTAVPLAIFEIEII